MYVEPLIGPDTINTLPRKTSAAFADRGKAAATLQRGFEEAEEVMKDLATVGIDLSRVTRRLLDEGIEKFIESYDDILQTIAAKSVARAAGTPATSEKGRRPSA
jgi:transaldolase